MENKTEELVLKLAEEYKAEIAKYQHKLVLLAGLLTNGNGKTNATPKVAAKSQVCGPHKRVRRFKRRYLHRKELAEVIGVCPRTVTNLITRGAIRYRQTGWHKTKMFLWSEATALRDKIRRSKAA